jgi:hypothetical protein
LDHFTHTILVYFVLIYHRRNNPTNIIPFRLDCDLFINPFHPPRPNVVISPLTKSMPHGIANAVFARTSLTTCDVFLMGLRYTEPHKMPSPEEFIESVRPWFLDAETVWWRKVWLDCR